MGAGARSTGDPGSDPGSEGVPPYTLPPGDKAGDEGAEAHAHTLVRLCVNADTYTRNTDTHTHTSNTSSCMHTQY